MKIPHQHQWIYDGRGCCFRLRCSLPGCEVQTKAYYIKGRPPLIGEPVRFTDASQETIEAIGTKIDDHT